MRQVQQVVAKSQHFAGRERDEAEVKGHSGSVWVNACAIMGSDGSGLTIFAWQRSTDNPDEFRKRVKVWVIPESVSIHSLEKRLQYTEHWNSERNRAVPLIEKGIDL